MKTQICNYLSALLPETTSEQFQTLLETPPESALGDFALPCFSFAKTLRKNPKLIAEELAAGLMAQAKSLGIAKAEAVNGYCNIFLDRAAYVKQCLAAANSENHGVAQCGTGKTVCMDYSSPNIAKNFHVGHLRTTVIGNSLYKIYEKLGWNVVRINHLGDWGTQFGKLIVAYKKWSSKAEVEEKGIEELMRIYVKFDNEKEKDASLMEEARNWFVKMEQNDEEALAIWNRFKDISLVEFERVYKLLGISFDSYTGESFYREKVPALVEELKAKNLLTESQGANVIDLSEYDMPPCLITKSDGGSIYHSRDIAAVLYRKQTYGFDKCLYVTGLEQTLHFKQVFTAVKVMGYDWAENALIHVPYGLVSMAGAKLSSRKGNIVYAEDILKEAMERAMTAIQCKNPELQNKEETAKQVGVGAVIFHDLFNQRIKNVDFNWEDVLSFEGTTGPYVQYTYARAKSILRKSGYVATGTEQPDDAECVKPDGPYGVNYNYLTDEAAYTLVKTLSGYEAAVLGAAERHEPSVVARYIISVASAFNKFYHECPILSAGKEEKQARLALVDAVQKVLKDACALLGMECPEEM